MTPLSSPEAFAALAKILEEREWTRALAEPLTPLGRLSAWRNTDTDERLIVAIGRDGITLYVPAVVATVEEFLAERTGDEPPLDDDFPEIGPITAMLAEPPKVD